MITFRKNKRVKLQALNLNMLIYLKGSPTFSTKKGLLTTSKTTILRMKSQKNNLKTKWNKMHSTLRPRQKKRKWWWLAIKRKKQKL